MAFFALNSVLQFFIEHGALFQALVASFRKVPVALEENPSSMSFPFEIDLELLIPSSSSSSSSSSSDPSNSPEIEIPRSSDVRPIKTKDKWQGVTLCLSDQEMVQSRQRPL